MASSHRTNDILAICGTLLRRGGVWTNGTPEHGPPLRMCLFKLKAPVEIRYYAIAEPVPGTKTFRPVRPKQLTITHNGRSMFVVKWDKAGKRRKAKDEVGPWEAILRRTASVEAA